MMCVLTLLQVYYYKYAGIKHLILELPFYSTIVNNDVNLVQSCNKLYTGYGVVNITHTQIST